MSKKLRVTTYLAGAIEAVVGKDKNSQSWKDKVKIALNYEDVGIYDPIEQESGKTGKSSADTCNHISGLKRGGHWDIFHPEMDKIWWGDAKPAIGNKLRMLQLFRDRASIDGNYKNDFKYWGDYEAVARSNFIIANLPQVKYKCPLCKKEFMDMVRTVGTYNEIHTAYLLDIPVYLILGQTQTEANSTLVHTVKGEWGEIFYNAEECIKFIKEKYKMK